MAQAAAGALSVITTVADLVGTALMIPGVLPDKDKDATVVRVAAGLSLDDADTTSGNRPGLALYDIVGRSIGKVKGKSEKITDGQTMDIRVPFDDGVGNKPVEYISVTNGGVDALCIAYISLTQPDGVKKAWYGDSGKDCGADWYHSQLKTGEDDYAPSCVWIDRDHSNNIRFQGFGLHITDFRGTKERAAQWQENKDLMCKAAPRFKMYEKMKAEDPIPFFIPPLEYGTDATDKDPQTVLDKGRWVLYEDGPNVNKAVVDAETPPPQPPKLRRRQEQARYVIMSKSPNHSARELCDSPTSFGQDFVSLDEGLFCDMSEKRLWPLCRGTKVTGCFDTKTSTMRAGAGLRGRDLDTGAYPPSKDYGKTVVWD